MATNFVLLFLLISLSDTYGMKLKYYQKTLNNGVHELQLSYNNIKFKESYIKSSDYDPTDVVLRQISNGRQVLTLIYNGIPSYYDLFQATSKYSNLTLKQCLIKKGKAAVESFENEFNKIPSQSNHPNSENTNSMFYEKSRRQIEDPESWELDSLLRFKPLRNQCLKLHRKLKRTSNIKRNHHRKDLSSILNRKRRGLEEVFILPGTKWCGNKRLARSYRDLDGHVSTDSCCRDHDLCPFSIPLLSKKYGMYNRHFTTLSHCACDKRFRTCLKQSSTGASDIVGKVFFNIVKSHCFVFEKKKTCLKSGLWNCFKWGYRKQAVIKSNAFW